MLAAVIVSMGCHGERTGVVVGPPLTRDAPFSSDAGASSEAGAANETGVSIDAGSPSLAQRSPIDARFVDLAGGAHASHESLKIAPCEQVFVAVARGTAIAADEKLAPGDVLFAQGSGAVDVSGEGLALFAIAHPETCVPPSAAPFTKKVVRASAAPAVTFAGGRMRARFDVEPPVSSLAYFGQLDGTAPVPEHAHDTAWEILCAVSGAGTFTMDGVPHRLGAKQIVMIPPAARHSWAPDPGSPLFAFQMYSPPGPEQRFKKIADGALDAGAPIAK